MGRLAILATFCPKGQASCRLTSTCCASGGSDLFSLKHRGATIFSSDEKDVKSAQDFLVVLLNDIYLWANQHKKDHRDPEQDSIFMKIYKELRQNGYSFPSDWQQYKEMKSGATTVRRAGSGSPSKSKQISRR